MATQDLERDLTQQSVGYLSKEDYKRKREELETEKAVAAMCKQAGGSGSGSGEVGGEAGGAGEAKAAAGEAKPKKSKKIKKAPSTLSFEDELEEESGTSPSAAPIKKMGKCQDADTSFLQKSEREVAEQSQKTEAAMREILQQQAVARAEEVTLAYTYRSEVTQRELPTATHRGSVTVRRGDSAEDVARAVRADVELLGGKFKPNQCAGVKDEREVMLVACCEGFTHIGSFTLPGSMNLVTLGTKRWSEGGPLFDDFKHGVVVCERRWYESQRHMYPYSHWRTYEPLTSYSYKEFLVTRNKPAEFREVRRECDKKR
jgi:hypothetical protein